MIWKPISDLPGYEVSDEGLVRKGSNLITIHKRKDRKDGSFIKIFIDGKQCKRSVAKLVAEAFIPNPDGKSYVRHLSGPDNNAENLRWCTRKELMGIMVEAGRKDWTDDIYAHQFESMKNNMLKPVIRIDPESGQELPYVSIHSTAEDGFTPGHVSRCCHGRTKTHGGYFWRFADEDEREEILKDAHDGIVRRKNATSYSSTIRQTLFYTIMNLTEIKYEGRQE